MGDQQETKSTYQSGVIRRRAVSRMEECVREMKAASFGRRRRRRWVRSVVVSLCKRASQRAKECGWDRAGAYRVGLRGDGNIRARKRRGRVVRFVVRRRWGTRGTTREGRRGRDGDGDDSDDDGDGDGDGDNTNTATSAHLLHSLSAVSIVLLLIILITSKQITSLRRSDIGISANISRGECNWN